MRLCQLYVVEVFSVSLKQLLFSAGFTHLTLNEFNMGLLVAILKGFSLFIGAAPYVPFSIFVFITI